MEIIDVNFTRNGSYYELVVEVEDAGDDWIDYEILEAWQDNKTISLKELNKQLTFNWITDLVHKTYSDYVQDLHKDDFEGY